MTVFEAFPRAIITGTWQLGQLKRTAVGKEFKVRRNIDVIVDEAVSGDLTNSPSADGTIADTLLYARPEQIGTANMAKIVGDYMVYNRKTRDYYEIINAGLGKNQEKGIIEHIELLIRATDVAEVVDGEC